MDKNKRYEVSLTENEMKIVIEAIGAYKIYLQKQCNKMVKKYGPPHRGRSLARKNTARSAQNKMTESMGNVDGN